MLLTITTVVLAAALLAATASAAPAPAGSLFGDPFAALPAAGGGTTVTCGYGTGGNQANTLCWLDMSNFNQTQAQSAGGQPMSVSLPGGYTISFTAHMSADPNSTKSLGAVKATAAPVWSGAYIGNVAYKNIPGKPVLYQSASGTADQITLSGITVTDISGAVVSGYGLVMADGESTDNGESLSFSSNVPLQQISTNTAQYPYCGNNKATPLGSGLSGIGTTTVTCVGGEPSGNGMSGDGALVVQANSPSTVTAQMIGSGQQGFAFALVTSQITLNKTITSRANAGDSFNIQVSSPQGTVIGQASTGTSSLTATTGTLTVLPLTSGTPYTLSEAPTPGSATVMSDYSQAWACTNGSSTSTTVLPGAKSGTSATVNPVSGDAINCTITNKPIPPSVSIAKHAVVSPAADADGVQVGDTVQYSYTVTNTGSTNLASVAVSDTTAGAVSCPTISSPGLAPGASVTCTASPYTVTQANVNAGSLTDTATATGTDYSGQVSSPSSPSSVTTPAVAANPSLSLQKIADASLGDSAKIQVGETIKYSYVVRNTGNVTITGLAVNDPTLGAVSCPASSLAPGASETCTANNPYTVTQANVDGGSATDTATASGSSPSGAAVNSPKSSVSIPSSPNPQVSIQKRAAVSPSADQTAAKLGDTIQYSYVVTNTGNTTLTSVAVSDPTAAAVSCPTPASPGLAPGASETCTANNAYTVTQADIDGGSVSDSATATGTDSQGAASPPSQPSTATVQTEAANPQLSLTKSAAVSPAADQTAVKAGDTIQYTYKVTNTGNVDLPSVAVTDTTLGPVTCPTPAAPGLAPGASETCTANNLYTVTQADVDAGKVVDSAYATGTDSQRSSSPASTPATVTVPTVAANPSVALVKHATVTPAADQNAAQVGDTISYSYTVQNTGNVDLTSVAVNDPTQTGGVSCPTPGSPGLAPGASETCTANDPYTVTQADVDNGSVSDSATASGVDADGTGTPTSSPSAATVQTVAAKPALSLRKVANASGGDDSAVTNGENIAYSYVVTNTGNVTISNVAVADSAVGGVSCPASSLAPGASETCTGSYTVTQNDVNSGGVSDTATASGNSPSGTSVNSAPSSVSVPSDPNPQVAIVKSGVVSPSADQNAANVGDTVQYSYVVTNIGNVTLSSVSVVDSSGGAPGAGPSPVTCTLPGGGLAPGASVTCTADNLYTVTQADVDAGKVVDTAYASGSDASGLTSPNSNPSTATIPAVGADPSVTVAKQASVTPSADQSGAKTGDEIQYSYTVTNSGNVDLASVAVSDPSIGPVNCPTPASPGLAPGASETCTANNVHTVTQADVDAGSITDTATATGIDTQGQESAQSAPSTATVEAAAANPSVAITKAAVVQPSSDQNGYQVGDTVSYQYTVTNTGNTTLTTVSVNDPSLSGGVSCATPSTGLAPGKSEVCTSVGPLALTQAEVDAGSISDTATASGVDVQGNTTPASRPATATLDAAKAQPSISIKKIANASDGDLTNPLVGGSTIKYAYQVTNSGNVTLTGVGVNDPSLDPSTATCPQTTLTPGQTETCTAQATYTLPAKPPADYTDTATATGTPPSGSAVTAQGSVSLPATAADPSLAIQKSSTVTPSSDQNSLQLGDKINYSYRVTNTGNVNLTSVKVNDSQLSAAATCPALPKGGLQPGASIECTGGPYTVTQADIDNGGVTDSATATGTGSSGGSSTSSPSSVTNPATTANPGVSISKHASVTPTADQGAIKVGDTIQYSYVVTNSGNVTLKSVSVDDSSRSGGVSCPTPAAPGLAPGASETCTANSSYTVTQADVDNGSVTDTATATATDTQGITSPPSAPSTATVPAVAASPSVAIAKAATVNPSADQSGYRLGDSISYRYTVTNTGNTTLQTVSVHDPSLTGGVVCPTPAAPGLAPGKSEICQSSTPVVVTQADVDAGSITDTATASGVDIQGNSTPTSQPATATVDAAAADPSISIVKVANEAATGGDLANPVVGGTEIQYSYVVTNSGNVTLTDVAVNDPFLSPNPTAADCPLTTLAPNQSETCQATAPYTVPATVTPPADLTDTATATGTPPTGGAVSAQGSVALPATSAQPNLTIQKRAQVNPSVDQNNVQLGDQISYTYTVTNIGNVNLSSVAVVDNHLPGGVSCPALPGGGLQPGDSITCTGNAAYTVTQGDIDNGGVTDSATANGTGTSGGNATSTPSTVTDPSTPSPTVTVQKIATVTPSADQSAVQVGDTINYTYKVTNSGNVDLPTITVSDPAAGPVSCPAPAAPGLAPGASETCTANGTHTVTQSDIDSGSVYDSATATGEDTLGNISPPASSAATVPAAAPDPAISLKKIATVTPNADQNAVQLGDKIQYTYLVKNTGNVTLNTVTVADPKLGNVSCPATADFAPGDTVTCTADSAYTVTQADVDAGSVSDSATAQADPSGSYPAPTPATDSVTDPASQKPAVSIVKHATVTPSKDNNGVNVGDRIQYSYTVTNSGNVDLTAITVTDPTLKGAITCTTPAAPGLAPGKSETCTANDPVTVTKGDFSAGKITDTATATGTTGQGTITPPSAPSTVTIPVSDAAALTVVKTVDHKAAYAGQKLAYTITVTDKGPAAAHNVLVTDSPSMKMTVLSVKPGHGSCSKRPLKCELGTLTNGEKVTIKVLVEVNEIGTERNTAHVRSSDPNPDPKGASSTATTKVSGRLTITKSASRHTIDTGQNVTYKITVHNPTTATIRNARVCDQMPNGLGIVSADPHFSANDGCWHVARVNGGATKVFRIIANAEPGAKGRKTNVAIATAKGVATVRASATVTVIPLKPVGCGSIRTRAEHGPRSEPHC